jgi:hypothetical protein
MGGSKDRESPPPEAGPLAFGQADGTFTINQSNIVLPVDVDPDRSPTSTRRKSKRPVWQKLALKGTRPMKNQL